MKVYRALALASENESKEGITSITRGRIYNIMQGAPSGSGIEPGTWFLLEESNREQIVFAVSFHHMTKNGYYDGQTYHRVVASHDLLGLNVRVTGRNRNGVREYLTKVYRDWLTKDVNWTTGEYID